MNQTPIIVKGDVSNWATLVIEIGIGVTIGLSIFVYSNFRQNKSGEVIKEFGKQEKFRKFEVLNGIQINLTISKGSLNYIDDMTKQDPGKLDTVKEEFERLKKASTNIDKDLESNYNWIGELTIEISNVNIAINNYALSQSFYDSKLDSIEKIRDRIEEIIPKIVATKLKFQEI